MGVYQPILNERVWISVNAIPIFEEGDTALPWFIQLSRYHRRTKANQNYQLLFNQMVDAFALHEIICDNQGVPVDYRFLGINKAFEEMTGVKAEDIWERPSLKSSLIRKHTD